ncbi:amino acid ABC transporter permease [Corynebacterium sp. 153RC1]|uniref:amino acid ABC transporter permease n=1 Tax=unclassified Corynebacterium TaxID=2624378 RepID=UPI00211D0068|nr:MULTISPECIES: amino acid ABC transporter permease [unclassified Corynebacterium]MCQ9352812.1 amino acid ABC transporter permease [Corynebacterium sp. 209RC1]MCQ9355204.1 amino acid ABC transporter permease [Corynebacterium sp. 1222RC1]MCQ9357391.1 amino acid ABC transporter permease [Corynebacterium sp. 122RC1]MCQ9359682.1 amino acid ABC transporter permease [Corynebacterium sp. 142RC1]MCQ9361695.1 amino acid ABC transporter permease [Corynebacterium sp. 153RC1]
MDTSVVVDNLPVYAEAAVLTVRVAAKGILVAFLVGLVCATIKLFRIPVLRQIVAAYIELSRNTPLLVQLFFLYFGLPKIGLTMSSETCAVVGLAFLGGSYMAEAIRTGLEAVEPIQMQSAVSLGMSRGEALRHVILPQAFTIALPAITANVIFLIKETSVVSVVALPDLVYAAKEQIGQSYETREALFLLVTFYLIILLPVSLGAGWLERKVRSSVFGS